jgi:hypothetical protein
MGLFYCLYPSLPPTLQGAGGKQGLSPMFAPNEVALISIDLLDIYQICLLVNLPTQKEITNAAARN